VPGSIEDFSSGLPRKVSDAANVEKARMDGSIQSGPAGTQQKTPTFLHLPVM